MSHVFRLHDGGNNTLQDWDSAVNYPYDKNALATIDDPNGDSAKHQITSIPSPFSRIDLVKVAFERVSETDRYGNPTNLVGNTIFHKMVSDTLDVAEIFFNIGKYRGLIDVLRWNPQTELPELMKSTSSGHQYLADALDKYLITGAQTYNFGQMQAIYLLNYVGGPGQLNIIGATSPATLFFSSANDLHYVSNGGKIVFMNGDIPFDNKLKPLFQRDPQFVQYLFDLRASIPGFSALFREVDDYLNATLKIITVR